MKLFLLPDAAANALHDGNEPTIVRHGPGTECRLTPTANVRRNGGSSASSTL